MNNQDDFFIGWKEEAPKSFQRLSLNFFIITLLLILGTGWLFTTNERGFIDSYFEYGTLTEIKGQLVELPVWGLRTEEDGVVKTIPLVGFGKHSAEKAMIAMRENNPQIQEGAEIILRGTLFYYDNRSWMELTEGPESLVSFISENDLKRSIVDSGSKTLRGEIIDPKCWFGVMNPADKAAHRSCAIRCISGGIPSILGIRKNGKFVDYYFLVNEDRKPLTKEVLSLVGLPVEISGDHWVYDDWNILVVNKAHLTFLKGAMFENKITMCE